MPTDPTSSTRGRLLVTKRAVVDVVRAATLGSYGVIGLDGGGPFAALAERLGFGPPGIRVRFGSADATDVDAPEIVVELDLLVAHGLPIAEVARQVDSAVRYAIRRALGRDVARLTIHVGGLRLGQFPPDEAEAGAPVDKARGGSTGRGRGGRASGGRSGRSGRKGGAMPPIAPDDLAASGTDVA